MIGDILWEPPADLRRSTEIGRFMEFAEHRHGQQFGGYDDLWRWSVEDLEGFWGSIWEFFGLRAHTPFETVLASREMPGAVWFPGARLNYAEHLVGRDEDADRVAVVAQSQTRPGDGADLRRAARAGGAGSGGPAAAGRRPRRPRRRLHAQHPRDARGLHRHRQPGSDLGRLRPRVRRPQRHRPLRPDRAQGDADRGRLRLPRPLRQPPGARSRRSAAASPASSTWWRCPTARPPCPTPCRGQSCCSSAGTLAFEPVAFDHPLYVLFSSGTTGLPKAIVHGHGGQLVEHHKNQGLGWDLKPGTRLQWFSTTAWMMWNALVSALLLRSSIVMLDGDPAWPDLAEQWRLAERNRPTVMGVSPPYLMACRKAGLNLRDDFDLRSIRVLCTAGSPLPAEGYRWVYEQLGPDVCLVNGSGGTDVCTGIVSGCPGAPVYEGEISCASLAVDAKAFDEDGHPVVGELGRARHHLADAVDAGGPVGRRGRRALPRLVLRSLPGRLAPGRLDQVHPARQLRAHRALRRHAQPRRRAPGHGRVLLRGRGVPRARRRARRAPRGRRGRDGRAAAVRGALARGDGGRRGAGTRANGAAQRALPPARARRHHRRQRRSRGR